MSWTPPTPSIWLDASDSSTITLSSGRVSQWNDKSNNNNHAVQTNASYRPVVSTAQQNGLDAVYFDSSTRFLEGVFSKTLTAQSVFIVCRFNTTSGYMTFFTQFPTGGDDWTATGHYIPVIKNNTQALGSWIDSSVQRALTAAYNTCHLFNSNNDGTNLENFNAGVSNGTSAKSLNYAVDKYRIGASSDDNLSYYDVNGYIYELLVYDYEVDTTTRQEIEGYLYHKWDTNPLNVAHTYYSDPPMPTYTGEGGGVIGGSALLAITGGDLTVTSNGGGIIGGTAIQEKESSETFSGGGVIGGSASTYSGYTLEHTSTGGMVIGGDAQDNTGFIYSSNGGGIIGGTAKVFFNKYAINGSFGISGDIKAVQWLNNIKGALGLNGNINLSQENDLSFVGSLGLNGEVNVTNPQSLAIVGEFKFNGLTEIQQADQILVSGSLGINGSVDIISQNLLSINGSFGFNSNIVMSIDGASVYSLTEHTSERWT